jgi:serine/threonine protein kinase
MSQLEPIIADFGLVNVVDVPGASLITYTKQSGGKPYMAPELVDFEGIGKRVFRRTTATDIYSFASLCLEARHFMCTP